MDRSISLSSLPDCLVCLPSSPASYHSDPEPACSCIDLPFWTLDLPFCLLLLDWPAYWIDLPVWTLDLPFCLLLLDWPAYMIDLPVWTLDLLFCLLLLNLFATRIDYLVWPLLGINTVSAPELLLLSCYWVLVCHFVKPDDILKQCPTLPCCCLTAYKCKTHKEGLHMRAGRRSTATTTEKQMEFLFIYLLMLWLIINIMHFDFSIQLLRTAIWQVKEYLYQEGA